MASEACLTFSSSPETDRKIRECEEEAFASKGCKEQFLWASTTQVQETQLGWNGWGHAPP